MASREPGQAWDGRSEVSRISTSRRPRILVGVTGSVAAVKAPEIAVILLQELKADVRVVLTRGGQNFWSKAEEYDPLNWRRCQSLINKVSSSEDAETRELALLHSPDDEWKNWDRLGDSVLHIDLRNWADIMLVAPLSAHSLAKFATGLCDDTLSCCLRAWDFGHGPRPGKPLILAPAMNTAMWNHPLTRSQLATLRQFWNESVSPNCVNIVRPQEKVLACGEIGDGALADVSEIVAKVKECIAGLESNHGLAVTGSETCHVLTRNERIRKALTSLARERFKEQEERMLKTKNGQKLVAPISPTHPDIISDVLPRLGLNSNSLLIDFGCGDGRWLVSAIKMYGCNCIGYDIDEGRLALARKELDRFGLCENAEVIQRDVFEAMESSVFLEATVVIVYLFREAMQKMSNILSRRVRRNKTIAGESSHGRGYGIKPEMPDVDSKPMRVLCIGFALPCWKPEWKHTYSGISVYLYHIMVPTSTSGGEDNSCTASFVLSQDK